MDGSKVAGSGYDTLASALVAAQAKMPAVPKTKEVEVITKTGGKYKYKYATLDDLIAATLPVLKEHGLSIIQLPAETSTGMPGLKTIILHESGEQLSETLPLSPGQGMQELGSSITYARRYAWSSALGIASEHDDDGASASAKAASATSSSAASQNTITDAQGKRLWAIAQESGVDAERLKMLVKEIAGVDSSKEVPKALYDQLVEAVQADSVPF
jgi:LysM repeat protein